MTETSTTTDRIARALDQFEPGARLLRTWPLNGGISATMTAFEYLRSDGTRSKKIAREPNLYRFHEFADIAEREFTVHRVLRDAGLPVQAAHYLEPKSEEAPRPFFVIDYIEGSPELNPADIDAFISRYAAQLAQIHRVDYRHLRLGFLPEQGIGYHPRRENLNDDLREGDIRAALESVDPISRSNPPVLRHGDFWPGNVLWRDGEIVAVIDWEETLIGEPLADLAICRLDLWWILGESCASDFTDRYQSLAGINLADLPYWDLCAALRPITNLAEWASSFPGLGRPDVTLETMTRDHRAFVAQALAKF